MHVSMYGKEACRRAQRMMLARTRIKHPFGRNQVPDILSVSWSCINQFCGLRILCTPSLILFQLLRRQQLVFLVSVKCFIVCDHCFNVKWFVPFSWFMKWPLISLQRTLSRGFAEFVRHWAENKWQNNWNISLNFEELAQAAVFALIITYNYSNYAPGVVFVRSILSAKNVGYVKLTIHLFPEPIWGICYWGSNAANRSIRSFRSLKKPN